MKDSRMNDQKRLNTALTKMHLEWNEVTDNETWVGRNANGFTVSILKFAQICRRATCNTWEKPHVYVWHRGGSRSEEKIKKAELDGTWILRDDWTIAQNSSAMGVEWLQDLKAVT